MANNLFISYDLHKPDKNYDVVIKRIKEVGQWARVHYSLYYVRSTMTSSQAHAWVRAAIDQNDSLIVIDASSNSAHWDNLDPQVSAWLQSNWYAAA